MMSQTFKLDFKIQFNFFQKFSKNWKVTAIDGRFPPTLNFPTPPSLFLPFPLFFYGAPRKGRVKNLRIIVII